MKKILIPIKFTERINWFEDRWNWVTEVHYTEHFEKEYTRFCDLELDTDINGNVLNTNLEIEKMLAEYLEGELIEWEVI